VSEFPVTVKLRAVRRKLDLVRRALVGLFDDNAALREQLELLTVDRDWWKRRAQAFALKLRDLGVVDEASSTGTDAG
jgi:hypothetical protein